MKNEAAQKLVNIRYSRMSEDEKEEWARKLRIWGSKGGRPQKDKAIPLQDKDLGQNSDS